MSLSARIRLKRFFISFLISAFGALLRYVQEVSFLLVHSILKSGICADAPVHQEQEDVSRIYFSACIAEKMWIPSLCAFSGSYERVKTCDINISRMEDRETLIFLPYT